MDPFRNIFAFIGKDDTKEEEEVENFFKDKNTEKKEPGLPKSNKTCFLCEEGEIHDGCTNIKKVKTKGKKADGKYVCDKCEYTSDKRICMKSHKEAVHLKIKHFRCSVCFYEKYRKHEIEFHMKSKHKDRLCRVLIIGCPLCERKVTHGICVKQPQKNNHQNGKTEKKKPSLPKNNKTCFLCEEGEVHDECTNIKKVKTKGKKADGEYGCDKCEYSSDTKILLRSHIKLVHLFKVKTFKCSACSYRSYTRQRLQVHVKRIHKDNTCRIMKIGCSLCETNQSHKICERNYENYDRKRKIKDRPTRVKKTNGKYSCDKCDYTSDQSGHMKTHKEAVHLKIKHFKCSVCFYEANRKYEIDSHMKLKHKDQHCRVLIIGCTLCERKEKHEICSKTFNNPSKNGKIKCNECGFTSNLEKTVSQHNEVIHMAIKRYFCRSCNFQSYYKHNIKTHIVNNHKSAFSELGRIGCESCKNNDDFNGCSDCGLKVKGHNTERKTSKKDSKNHGESVNLKNTLLSCEDCKEFFDNIERLKYHESNSHSDIARFSCNLCDYMGYFKLLLVEHQKDNHKGLASRVIKIGCEKCGENTKGHECDSKLDALNDDLEKTVKIYGKKDATTEKKRSIKSESGKPKRGKGILIIKGINKCSEKNCDFSSDYKESLTAHVERAHKGILKFKCNICDFKSYHKHIVKSHQKKSSHSENATKVLRIGCIFCEEDIIHTEHSNRERKVRKARRGVEGNLICLAPGCTYVTDVKQNLTLHYHSTHTDFGYSCNLCSYRGIHGGNVERHQRANHHKIELAKVIGLGCKACEENIEHKKHTFPAKPFDYGICLLCKDGIEHSEHEFTTVHSNGFRGGKGIGESNKRGKYGRNTEECLICGIKLTNRKSHVQHYQQEHPNDKIFNCKDCKYATNFLQNLNTHASSMHEKKVRQCSLCSYNTTWNSAFLEHMRCVHGLFKKKGKHFVESEANPILCDDCGFSTFNPKQFNDHKLANCHSKHTLQNDINYKSQMRYTSSITLKVGNFKYEIH